MSLPPLTISCDEDVDFFLVESCKLPHRPPLCVINSPRMSIPERVNNSSANSVDDHPHISSWLQCNVYADFLRSTYPNVDDHPVNEVLEGKCILTKGFSQHDTMAKSHPIRETNSQEVDIPLRSTPTEILAHCPFEDKGIRDTATTNVNDIEEPIINHSMSRINAIASRSTFASASGVHSLETIKMNERVDDSCGFVVGELIESKEALKTRLSMYALTNNFQFKTVKSGKDILVVACLEEKCEWRIRATGIKNSTFFRIRKAYNTHTCYGGTLHRDNRQAASKFIAQTIKHKYEGVSSAYAPGDIQRDVQKQLGLTISYHKAWRAKEFALQIVRGSSEKSFSLLPSYSHVLMQTNNGTLTCIETDSTDHFKYYFMSIGSCMRGFCDSIRPVIAVDGTFLKGKYKGTLFVASCVDGNNQIYPLAFGVGGSECDATWEWFMTKLSVVVDGVQNLVVISDRNGSIKKAVAKVFPGIPHGICMYHLSNNIKARFNKIEGLVPAFILAAKAYRRVEFQRFMSQISSSSISAAQYLHEVGVEKWARSHFEGRRYSIMTTNIAECLNGVLKEARRYPIHKLMDHIRWMHQTWFEQRRRRSIDCNTHLTPWAEEVIRVRSTVACTFHVEALNLFEYIVTDLEMESCRVNMHGRECSCFEWQFDQLPCRHALAVCKHRGYNYYEFCFPFYSRDAWIAAYAETIYPVGPVEEWNVLEAVSKRQILPPSERRRKGRPKNTRIPSLGEESIIRKCSHCGDIGYNRRSCTNPIPLPQTRPTGIGNVSEGSRSNMHRH